MATTSLATTPKNKQYKLTKADIAEQMELCKIGRFKLPTLPKGMGGIYGHANAFRKRLELEVHAKYGKPPTLMQHKLIASAYLAFRQAMVMACVVRHARLPGFPYRDHEPVQDPMMLTHEQWMSYSDRILKYNEKCDRILEGLGLNEMSAGDMYDTFYAEHEDVTNRNHDHLKLGQGTPQPDAQMAADSADIGQIA